jgi:hypothetical protein
MAWVLTAVAGSVGASLFYLSRPLPLIFWASFLLLLLVALAITFSHWLERRTMILLDDQSVSFRSPLREVTFGWNEVEKVLCVKIQGGWRFMVVGTAAAFRFQSLVTLRSGFGRTVRSGYAKGVEMATFIRRLAGLDQVHQEDQVWIYSK